jgi:NH3-dependent NAD+ synthetase
VLLMALSNKLGGLLLTTGNKSEYAVGYATIYGDMCGGFAPIKDLYKTEVYALCRWRNAQGDGEVIPAGVIERAPSAELRENQTDQDSLPPYEVLDGILERHVDQEKSGARSSPKASTKRPCSACSSWCGRASGSGARPRPGRSCRGVPSAASAAIRSRPATRTERGRARVASPARPQLMYSPEKGLSLLSTPS